MASEFLKSRYPQFLSEIAGEETAGYIVFDGSTKDSLTGDIDETAAYAAAPVNLPAWINLFPSEAMRRVAGLEVNFDATIQIPSEDIDKANLSPAIGDAVLLPQTGTTKWYVVKIVKEKQSEEDFLAYLIFLTRTNKTRG